MTPVWLDLWYKSVGRPWTTVSITNFLYFNSKAEERFIKTFCNHEITNKLFCKKNNYFIYNFIAILNHFFLCVTERRTNVNRGCNLEIPYLLTVLLSISFNKLPWWELIKILVEKLHAHQNRNAPSGLTSAHCDWVCHAMHKNVCMLEWHAIKHPYLPTYLGCMIKLLIYFYAS